MKIVKRHKHATKTSEMFGCHPGKTVTELENFKHGIGQISSGGYSDELQYIKIGDCTHDFFLWIDNFEEARAFGEKLIAFADEADRRKSLQKG